MSTVSFNGFTKNTVDFFSGLENNNSRGWFESHREIYQNYVQKEAQNFVMHIGSRLQKEVSLDITAIPKIDKSIFRLHRDVRFSTDKSPYKTHLGIYFWEGDNKKLENPGFYFQLNARELMWGVGFHLFSKTALKQWRLALNKIEFSRKLNDLNREILSINPEYSVEGKHYKKVPRGFAADHPQAKWLLYNGVAYIYRQKISDKLYSPACAEQTMEIFHNFAPIHTWLMKMIQLKVD